jgi:hypothetical protein
MTTLEVDTQAGNVLTVAVSWFAIGGFILAAAYAVVVGNIDAKRTA